MENKTIKIKLVADSTESAIANKASGYLEKALSTMLPLMKSKKLDSKWDNIVRSLQIDLGKIK